MITITDMDHITALAQIELSSEEKEIYLKQMNDIFAYTDKIKELNTENVPPTFHVLALQNAFREDRVREDC